MRQITIGEALREGLREEMNRDESVFMIGEDIGHIGGSVGATKGLFQEFGPERIIDTPISEAAIMGTAVGAALAGFRPVAEIMFCDWLPIAMNQLVNYAGMLTYALGGQVRIPLVLRTTVGVHGGAMHSKFLEAWVAHVPGLKVVMPSTASDMKGLIKSAIRDDNPVVLFENRHLYKESDPVPEGEYLVPIWVADVKRQGKDVTIIATSKMLREALVAAEELSKEGVSAEVIDPRTLAPLDLPTLVRSARKTRHVLVAHDAWRRYGVGAEIAASITEELFEELEQPVRRLGFPDVPPPFSLGLDAALRPNATKIVTAVREMLSKKPIAGGAGR